MGAGGDCARPMGLPDPSPALDKSRAPMGPAILSSTGAGVWTKAPMAFPDSSSVLDKFQSARNETSPKNVQPLLADYISWLQVFRQHFLKLCPLRSQTQCQPRGPCETSRCLAAKLSPHCLATIFGLQVPSPKLSPNMPPKLCLAHKRGI